MTAGANPSCLRKWAVCLPLPNPFDFPKATILRLVGKNTQWSSTRMTMTIQTSRRMWWCSYEQTPAAV